MQVFGEGEETAKAPPKAWLKAVIKDFEQAAEHPEIMALRAIGYDRGDVVDKFRTKLMNRPSLTAKQFVVELGAFDRQRQFIRSPLVVRKIGRG